MCRQILLSYRPRHPQGEDFFRLARAHFAVETLIRADATEMANVTLFELRRLE
jgi:hypothetical protein